MRQMIGAERRQERDSQRPARSIRRVPASRWPCRRRVVVLPLDAGKVSALP